MTPSTPLPNDSTQTRLIRIGRFAIKHELGRGSIGVVYLAHDPIIDREVAIKTFRSRLSLVEKKQHEQHFINEARAAGRLAHPNIVTVYEASSEGDSTYIAMEYLQGRELNKLLDAGHRFTAEDVASISWKIADALDHAHKNGVVHRDIKPANIFLVADHQPKVVDFGIARAPNRVSDQAHKAEEPYTLFHDNILGTPNYMSPEQAMGQAVDARTDIYSLGAVMYEMLTFRKPFQAADTDKLLHQIAFKAAPDVHTIQSNVPLALSKIVAKAMSKKADKRYQNAEEMALDIKRYLTRTRREHERKPKAERSEQPANAPTFQQSRLFWPVCGVVIAVLIAAYSFWTH
ncbi:serine/threonine protein kinase [Herminiimonas arsenitoxidans]|uniref:serine/threonine protein kinase n=1 Tax=Herminiimonas arsenitoxidans TaxID=1809410 RepID=UPI0009709956|nr:serine/threonine-protein kinase [Herminiimonas arsenitoxidans]